MESTKFLKVIRLRESSLRNSRTQKLQRIGITATPTKESPSTAKTGRSITDSLLKVSTNAINGGPDTSRNCGREWNGRRIRPSLCARTPLSRTSDVYRTQKPRRLAPQAERGSAPGLRGLLCTRGDAFRSGRGNLLSGRIYRIGDGC